MKFEFIFLSILIPVCFFHLSPSTFNGAQQQPPKASLLQSPSDVVLSCKFPIDTNKLKEVNENYIGGLLINPNEKKELIIEDIVCPNYCKEDSSRNYPGINIEAGNIACGYYQANFDSLNPNKIIEMNFGTWGYAIDVHSVSIELKDHRICGCGLIERIFTAIDNNTILSDTQKIWVINCHDVFINTMDLCDPDDDLNWRFPYCDPGYMVRLNDCMESPDSLSQPRLRNPYCNQIAIEYKDEISTGDSNSCIKIKRIWSIIDWCIYDPFVDPKKGRWELQQNLEINDQTKPTVKNNIGDCQIAFKQDNLCYAPINLTAEAFDNCTPENWLLWEYKIDIDNDSKGIYNGFDYQVGKLSKQAFRKGEKPAISDNPYADNKNNPFDATGDYPLGTHKICWFVEDGCKNVSASCEVFEIKDCMAPYVSVKSWQSFMFPESGCVTIDVKDLVERASDNCSAFDKLKFYFDRIPNKTSVTICCDDLVKQVNTCFLEVDLDLEVWVEDEAGNRDYSKSLIFVYDRLDVCPFTNDHKLKLQITDYKNQQIGGIEVFHSLFLEHFIDEYSCDNNILKRACNDVPIRLEKYSQYGVDVLDLIQLNEQLNGHRNFSRMQYHIADINKSKSITTADRILLSSEILQRKTKEWFFFQTLDSTPLINYKTFTCKDSCSLFGLLKGDLNFNALNECFDSITIPNQCISIRTDLDSIPKNTDVEIPIYFNSNQPLMGFQFDLLKSTIDMNFVDIVSSNPNLKIYQYTSGIEDTILRILCYENLGLSFAPDPNLPLFKFIYLNQKFNRVSDILKLNNQLKENAVYDKDYVKYGICMDLNTSISNSRTEAEFTFYPNPNPGKFIISGEKIHAIDKLEIIGSNGQLLFELDHPKSENNKIDIDLKLPSGLYFCKLIKQGQSFLKKFYVINSN